MTDVRPVATPYESGGCLHVAWQAKMEDDWALDFAIACSAEQNFPGPCPAYLPFCPDATLLLVNTGACPYHT